MSIAKAIVRNRLRIDEQAALARSNNELCMRLPKLTSAISLGDVLECWNLSTTRHAEDRQIIRSAGDVTEDEEDLLRCIASAVASDGQVRAIIRTAKARGTS